MIFLINFLLMSFYYLALSVLSHACFRTMLPEKSYVYAALFHLLLDCIIFFAQLPNELEAMSVVNESYPVISCDFIECHKLNKNPRASKQATKQPIQEATANTETKHQPKRKPEVSKREKKRGETTTLYVSMYSTAIIMMKSAAQDEKKNMTAKAIKTLGALKSRGV